MPAPTGLRGGYGVETHSRALTRGFCVRRICDKSVEVMVTRSIGLFALICVVKSELCDLKIPCSNSVNHTMLIRDSAGPETRKGVFQGFRFPDPIIVASHSVLDQLVDSSDHLLIRL